MMNVLSRVKWFLFPHVFNVFKNVINFFLRHFLHDTIYYHVKIATD